MAAVATSRLGTLRAPSTSGLLLAAAAAALAPRAAGPAAGSSRLSLGSSARARARVGARAVGVAGGGGSSVRRRGGRGNDGSVAGGGGGGAAAIGLDDLEGGKVKGGDLDGADGPGDAVVVGAHGTDDVLADGEGVDVAGVGARQGDGDVGPGVGGDEAAVLLGALDGGAEALGLAVAGGQGGDDGAAEVDGLGVVAGAVVVEVVEGQGLSGFGGGAFGLNDRLGGGWFFFCQSFEVSSILVKVHTTGGLESVGVGAPVVGVVVLSNGLDQVTVGRAHANPQRQVAGVVGGHSGKGQGGPGLDDVGVAGGRAGGKGRAHGSVGVGNECRQGKDDVARDRHLER